MACALGIDVGGTKIAAGAIELPEGKILARRLQPTSAQRGGEAVLEDVIQVALSLRDEVRRGGGIVQAIGIGVAELVDRQGGIQSAATIAWLGVPVTSRVSKAIALPVTVEADVRAAAAGEARLGAGRDRDPFLYVTIGTGISACLVIGGRPYVGARGYPGTFASSPALIPGSGDELIAGPPLEAYAAGPALAARYAVMRTGFQGTAREVMEYATTGDADAARIVQSAGRALGAAVAQLVNTLDPEVVVLGGGLGLAGGIYRVSLVEALREFVWSNRHRDIQVLDSRLGTDAGWIGAANAAATTHLKV
jgi:glucokinase